MTVYTFLYAAMLIAWPVYAIVSRICSCVETRGLYERARKDEDTEDAEDLDDSEADTDDDPDFNGIDILDEEEYDDDCVG